MANVEQSTSGVDVAHNTDVANTSEGPTETLTESSVAQPAHQGTAGEAQDLPGETRAAENGKETSPGAGAPAASTAADPAQPAVLPTPHEATPAKDVATEKVAAVVDNKGSTTAEANKPSSSTETTAASPSAEPATTSQPNPVQKTASKIVVSLRRLSATFVPRPSLVGHLKEGEIEKIEKQKQEQEQQQQQPAAPQTQDDAVSPPDQSTVTGAALVEEPQENGKVEEDNHLNGTAATRVGDTEHPAPASDSASPTSRGIKYKHTVNDIRRRLSHSFKVPLIPHEVSDEGEEKPKGAVHGEETAEGASAHNADTNETETTPETAAATTMPATTGTGKAGPLPQAHGTDLDPAAAGTTTDVVQNNTPTAPSAAAEEPKPSRRQLWQTTLRGIFRLTGSEHKERHSGDWAGHHGAQEQEQMVQTAELHAQSSLPAETKNTSTRAIRAQRRRSTNPPTSTAHDHDQHPTVSLSFFAKVRQAIKDEFGKDFPASENAQRQGKTRKKIGTVLVHLQGGQMVKAERQGKEANTGAHATDESAAAAGKESSKTTDAAGNKKKKKNGDDDNDSPKGPPAVPTEHAIYSQDGGGAQQAQNPGTGPAPAAF